MQKEMIRLIDEISYACFGMKQNRNGATKLKLITASIVTNNQATHPSFKL